MADPRFYGSTGPHSLAAIAAAVGAQPVSGGQSLPEDWGTRMIHGLASLEVAGPAELGFCAEGKRAADLPATRAGAVLVTEALAARVPPGTVALIVANPLQAMARAALLFHPDQALPPPLPSGEATTIHPSAVIDPSARIDGGCRIDAHVVIGAGAVLGAGCVVQAGAVIGPGVQIGPRSLIGPTASIAYAVIGAAARIGPGCRIGGRGFGFTAGDPARGEAPMLPVPHLGRVVIGDGVQLGANCTVDRGMLGDTVIGAGTVVDNLVHIGHNASVGRGCILVAQSGLAGSAVLEDRVVIAGQAAVADHVRIGTGARLAGQSAAISDVPPGLDVGGTPAVPVRQWHRQSIALANLVKKSKKGD